MKITLATIVGPMEVEAEEVVPGLAVHLVALLDSLFSDQWSITHIASGLRIGQVFETEAQAVAFAEHLAPLADWREDRETLRKVDGLGLRVLNIISELDKSGSIPSKEVRDEP